MENETQLKKEAKTKKSVHSSVRVSRSTGKQLKQALEEINKKTGRHIGADALLERLMTKLTESDVSELQEKSLRNKDRFERDYQAYCSQHGKITDDEYLGIVMAAAKSNKIA
jgi:hypothetical protein